MVNGCEDCGHVEVKASNSRESDPTKISQERWQPVCFCSNNKCVDSHFGGFQRSPVLALRARFHTMFFDVLYLYMHTFCHIYCLLPPFKRCQFSTVSLPRCKALPFSPHCWIHPKLPPSKNTPPCIGS